MHRVELKALTTGFVIGATSTFLMHRVELKVIGKLVRYDREKGS